MGKEEFPELYPATVSADSIARALTTPMETVAAVARGKPSRANPPPSGRGFNRSEARWCNRTIAASVGSSLHESGLVWNFPKFRN